MQTLLAFLLTLGLLIVVHEWGHYAAARRLGVAVLRFSVGFGPVLWRRSLASGTEFVVCALPLGGYVRMADSREGPLAPAVAGRPHDRLGPGQRAQIAAAGPAANLMLAVVLYAASAWWGVEELAPVVGHPPAASVAAEAGLASGDRVLALAAQGQDWVEVPSMGALRRELLSAWQDSPEIGLRVRPAGASGERVLRLMMPGAQPPAADTVDWARLGLASVRADAVMGAVREDGPAQRAGLRPADRVLAVDEVPVVDASDLRTRIQSAPGRLQRWTVERGGQTLLVEVTPRSHRQDGGGHIGRIDAVVGAMPERLLVQAGPLEGVLQGLSRTWDMAALSVSTFGRMLVGEASLRQLSGPLTIAEHAGQSAGMGVGFFLSFLAVVSVSLGVLNLLPLPMLDGGHLIYYAVEGLTGRPIPERWLARLQRGGAVVLLLMMSIALSNDLVRLLGLE
ncbi:RIP metalloprotease RseP [Ideonella livida]|uniref:Zinc metalloprotease n=1 Tax=Ideonella livida TaxID=2707176 RepID=A0A7C9TIV2_9BURK|nr:RIP metalloprotease RseP [Ideonella livida]NDY90684.1 RIP metalloprotease RseP [Ideonella livida]